MKIKNFKDLEIWQEAKNLAVEIFKITSDKRFNWDLSFRDQIRKSVVSIASNIAEGFERDTKNELIRFFQIAKGSSAELITQITIASEIKFIEEKIANNLINKLNLLNAKIGKFISYLKKISTKTNKSPNQPTSQPANQQTNHLVNQPTSQPANQQTNHLVNQPTSQLVNQLTR